MGDAVKEVTLNEKDRLYVIHEGGGYSCLGFDVCEKRRERLATELASRGITPPVPEEVGTLDNYRSYRECCELARAYNHETGHRFTCELHPKLLGFEHERVEVTRSDGSKVRFQVGKSTGWVPSHLAMHNRRSSGGMAISHDDDIVSVRVV